MKKIKLVLVFASLASSLVATPAQAANPPDGSTLTMHRGGDDILWAELSLEDESGGVRIYIRAPRKDRGSSAWQKCSFALASEGTYRCGMDVAAGSIAAAHPGKWFARATVDGDVVDRTSFRIGSVH